MQYASRGIFIGMHCGIKHYYLNKKNGILSVKAEIIEFFITMYYETITMD